MTAIRINGFDIGTTFGWVPDGVPGWLAVTPRRIGLANVYGRAGGIVTTVDQYAPRILQIAGTLQKTSATLRRDAEREIQDLCAGGPVHIVVDEGAANPMGIEGHLTGINVTPLVPSMAPIVSRLVADFLCPSGYWQDIDPWSRVITTTARSVQLGTAPSSPIIRIMGAATNPVLTYRSVDGTAQKTLTITGTLAATNDWIDIDMRTGVIRAYVSGVISNAFTTYAITGDFPWAFDPQDGDFATGGWPTLECSAGGCIAYWWSRYQ
jgi:hypothetical protein